MFLYSLYLMIFAFMPISYLFAPPEGNFVEEPFDRTGSTESTETVAQRQHTEPKIFSRENSTLHAKDSLKKQNTPDPKLTEQLKKTAAEKYKTKLFFKDTRTTRYHNQAQKLPSEIQQLLVDLSNKKTSSTTFQSSSKETLADVQTAIKTIEASKKGTFYSQGEQSRGLLEDLKNLETTLKTRTGTSPERQQETGKATSLEQALNRWAEHNKQQQEIAQRDQVARQADRQRAKAATADDYVADSAFKHTDSKNPELDPSNVTDEKRTVLTKQLTSLQKKLEELIEQKEDAGYSQDKDINDQINALQKEITSIHEDLAGHHMSLHGETMQDADSLTNEERLLKSPSYLYRKPLFFKDGNRYNVGNGTLFDLEQRVKALSEQQDNLSKRINGRHEKIRQKGLEQQQNTAQIRTLTQENSALDATMKTLQSKIAKTDSLLAQSFPDRIITERKEGGSVKEAKGIIETGKATAKLSDAELKKQKQDLTAQLESHQLLKTQNSTHINALRNANEELAKQQEELQAQQAKLETQQTNVEQERVKSAAWLKQETTRLEKEREQRLQQVVANLKKAQAATQYHKSMVQQHQPTTVHS